MNLRVLLILAALSCANAQTFEVASVKVATPGTNGRGGGGGGSKTGRGSADPNAFFRRNVTLANLIVMAYSLKPYQVVGPEWLTSERYDINAKAAEGSTQDQKMVMLQHLLADRFGLKVHRESKEMPVYELVVGKGGPKCKPSTRDNEVPPPGASDKVTMDPEGYPILPPGVMGVTMPRNGVAITVMHMQISMAALASRFSSETRRPVTDHTGLQGNYDVAMHWALDMPSGNGADASDPAPTIFEAVQTQLGLKLEPKKAMMEVMIVDHADKIPTEN